MRDVLLKRVRPLVERLAADLTELAVRRMEVEIERIEESLEVALSAYQSADVPDLLAAALGPELAAMLAGGGTSRHTTIDDDGKRGSGQPAPHVTQQGADTPGHRASEAAGNVADPHCTPIGHRGAEPSSSTFPNAKKPITCSKCGFVGGNARGCGRAHPTLERPPARPAYMTPEREITRGPVVTSSPTIAPRRAKADPGAQPMTAIAPARTRATPGELAAARERIALIAARNTTTHGRAATPARDDNENAEERWSPSRIAAATKALESNKLNYELPEPSSTFVMTPRMDVKSEYGGDLGDVKELDFGDAT